MGLYFGVFLAEDFKAQGERGRRVYAEVGEAGDASMGGCYRGRRLRGGTAGDAEIAWEGATEGERGWRV